jgi:hypothetical protein
MLKMELTRDERAALAEEYIIMTLDKYKADFADRYNRSQEPDRLLKMEQEKYDRIVNEEANTRNRGTPDGKPVTVTAIGHGYLKRAGSYWGLTAKYNDKPTPYGWSNHLAAWIHRYVISGRADIADAVTFTEIVPGETSFTPGDAVALYRYFKWLEAGKIGPEVVAGPRLIQEKLLAAMLENSPGDNPGETWKLIARTIPKQNGGDRAPKDVEKRRGDFLNGSKCFKKAFISQIISDLENKGKLKDHVLAEAVKRFAH